MVRESNKEGYFTSVIVGICDCVCVYMHAGLQYAYRSLCKWGCALVSWATNSSAHTRLHSSTFRHSDESHAPFLHFCSRSVLLGHTDSYLSVAQTYTHTWITDIGVSVSTKKHINRKRHVLNVPSCPDIELWEVGELSSNLFMSTVQ